MTPEQLQAALNALMEAGLDGDALAAATKALTDAFSSTAEVTDDEAVDAMEPDMAASFRAADTSDDDKAALLKAGRFNARQIKVAVALANAKAKPVKDATPAGFSAKDLEAAVAKGVTKALPPQGRVAAITGNPTGMPAAGSRAGFCAKVKTIMGTGVGQNAAVRAARAADQKGFQEYTKAGSKLD